MTLVIWNGQNYQFMNYGIPEKAELYIDGYGEIVECNGLDYQDTAVIVEIVEGSLASPEQSASYTKLTLPPVEDNADGCEHCIELPNGWHLNTKDMGFYE